MRIIDRYILKQVLFGYLLVLNLFIFLFLIGDFLSNLTDILKTKTHIFVVIKYYIYMIPTIFKWVSPYAFLISTLYIFSELNKNNEIISIRVAGISIFKIIKGVLLLSILFSLITLFAQENIILVSKKRAEEVKLEMSKKDVKLKVEKNLSFSSKNFIIFANSFFPNEKKLEDVTIFEENNKGEIIRKLLCKYIIYKNNKWFAKDIVEYNISEDGRIISGPHILNETTLDIPEKPNDLVFKKSIFLELRSIKSLLKEAKRLKKIKAYDKYSKLIIDINQKIAEPFSHFFLIFGALPFVLEIKKRHPGLSSLGFGFIFGFLYYSFFYLSIAFGKSQVLLPILSVWLIPIFFVIVGFTGLILIR